MEFFEVLEKRRSVRKFKEKEIPSEILEKILYSSNLAPSAGNLQAYKIYVVKDKETKKEIADAAYGQEFIAEAPIVLVFCAVPEESSWKYGPRGEKLYCIQDATIVCAYAQLAATALGLGSVWVGAFDEERIKKIIGTENIPVAVLPVGYPDEALKKRKRKDLNEIVKFIYELSL
ncbi:MAG: nitroreductase family protein [archaeon]